MNEQNNVEAPCQVWPVHNDSSVEANPAGISVAADGAVTLTNDDRVRLKLQSFYDTEEGRTYTFGVSDDGQAIFKITIGNIGERSFEIQDGLIVSVSA